MIPKMNPEITTCSHDLGQNPTHPYTETALVTYLALFLALCKQELMSFSDIPSSYIEVSAP